MAKFTSFKLGRKYLQNPYLRRITCHKIHILPSRCLGYIPFPYLTLHPLQMPLRVQMVYPLGQAEVGRTQSIGVLCVLES